MGQFKGVDPQLALFRLYLKYTEETSKIGFGQRHGKEMLFYASQDVAKNLQVPLKHKSPRYTTLWSDIPRI